MSLSFGEWLKEASFHQGGHLPRLDAAWHARDAALEQELAVADRQMRVFIELRNELVQASRAATLREAADKLHDALKACQQENMNLPVFGPGLQQAITICRALIDPAAQSALDRERAEARLEEARWWYETVPTAPMADERIAALRQAAQGSVADGE